MTRKEAVKYIKSQMCKDCGVYLGGGKCSDDCKVIEAIKALEQEPKTGHWIDDTSLGYHVSICSNCDWRGHGDTCLIYKPKYCPNCGAKMQEVEE